VYILSTFEMRAVQLLALTIADYQPEYVDKLVAEALGLLDQATAIEEAAARRQAPEALQASAQLQQQIRPKKGQG
jgi:hypothetical protein